MNTKRQVPQRIETQSVVVSTRIELGKAVEIKRIAVSQERDLSFVIRKALEYGLPIYLSKYPTGGEKFSAHMSVNPLDSSF